MKIKKVDDKPMVIHTKKKTTIHYHTPKRGKLKAGNVYTAVRSPKGAKAHIVKKGPKRKQTYRSSTVHQVKKHKERDEVIFLRKMKQSNASIKTKKTKLHVARQAAAVSAQKTADQNEGGQELAQASLLAYELSRPVTGVASKGAKLFKEKTIAEAKKRIKKVDTTKKLAKQTAKKAAQKTTKAVVKETAKETAKKTAKAAAKTAATTAVTAAGTAVAPGVGTAAGMAAGYLAGASMEVKDAKMTNRARKIKFFLDKMKAQENQTDTLLKLAKDIVVKRFMTWVKVVAPVIGTALLAIALLIAIVAVPVLSVTAIIYNSPFALFLQPLEAGDTVQTVTTAYVSEFDAKVNELVQTHPGCDTGELVYIDYEGTGIAPDNYYDIMAVYMVKYGVGETATIMNNTSKGWLQSVVNDMCTYTTRIGRKSVNGSIIKVLYVDVKKKTYRDMISEYGFDANQVEMLEQIMTPDFMGQLGWSSGSGGGTPGVCSLTEAEINGILNGITDMRQKTVCSYALHRVGYPYSQDYRDSGNYYDCSSLAYYSWRDAGVNISCEGSTTAAAEAKGLETAGKTVSYSDMQPGDLIFYSFTSNGRYRNISHVAIYVGNGKVVEALNSRVGVIYRDVASTGKIVVIGRP